MEDYTDSLMHPQIVLVSYNEKYEPKSIHPSDMLTMVGKVV